MEGNSIRITRRLADGGDVEIYLVYGAPQHAQDALADVVRVVDSALAGKKPYDPAAYSLELDAVGAARIAAWRAQTPQYIRLKYTGNGVKTVQVDGAYRFVSGSRPAIAAGDNGIKVVSVDQADREPDRIADRIQHAGAAGERPAGGLPGHELGGPRRDAADRRFLVRLAADRRPARRHPQSDGRVPPLSR